MLDAELSSNNVSLTTVESFPVNSYDVLDLMEIGKERLLGIFESTRAGEECRLEFFGSKTNGSITCSSATDVEGRLTSAALFSDVIVLLSLVVSKIIEI
jgi:hypothetical protein